MNYYVKLIRNNNTKMKEVNFKLYTFSMKCHHLELII